MIWDSVEEVYILESKGEDAIREIFSKAGFPEMAEGVIERERLFPSSIGKGIYLIRRMADVEEPSLFIGRSESDLGLEAYDDKPIKLLLLALLPEDEEQYATYLAHLFKLLNIQSIREDLLNVRNEEEASTIFRREEEG